LTGLNWQNLQFHFTGTGGTQVIRIVSEPGSIESNGRGSMIDNIALSEALPLNTGYQDGPICLSAVQAALTDTDGSEQLAVTVGAIPEGATLSDGTNSFTATADQRFVDVSAWSLASLSITAPAGFSGSFALSITATATESANGDVASFTASLPVTVLAKLAQPVAAPAPEHECEHHHHHDDAHEHDGGDWHLDHGMVTFKDGHTATLGDTYFELGKPGSNINLYSAAQPAADTAKAKPAAVVIDWSAANAKQADADDARKKTVQPANWLSSFLGVDNGNKQNAASLSKLSVTLDKKDKK
ncbi:MAG TPA: hypothetical protein VFR06_07595, partial [Gallionellaceae bacterium]|nr:hypothetical protein [Gallionellaceae bacterium]